MRVNSAASIVGVLPPITTFTSCGTDSAAGIRAISSMLSGASMKVMSAPASMKRWARSMALSNPSIARASVRAMIRKSSFIRASTAALTLEAASAAGITALPLKCPHFFGMSWSSSWIALAPARSSERTVCRTLRALPKPVSASTMMGSSTASRAADVCCTRSARLTKPRSGMP